MPLINTAGLTIIGDGSQWFWSMLAFLALPITGYAIYSQLRIARSTRAREEVEGLDREWDSERLMRYRLELLRAMRDGVASEFLPRGSAAALSNFWQRIGQLIRTRHLDVTTFHGNYSGICQAWWTALGPGLRRARAERNQPGLNEDFEWLAGRMAELDRQARVSTFDGMAPIVIAHGIEMLEDQLRVEEALRTVGVASDTGGALAAAPSRR